MVVEKKVVVEFEKDEKEIVEKFITIFKDFKEDGCEYMSCSDCPFEKLCDGNISSADDFIADINENLE